MPQPANNSQRFAFNRILIGGLILYVCAFAILLRNKSFDATGAVVVLIVFGIVFPLIAWITTAARHSALDFRNAGQIPINRPNRIHYCLVGLPGRRSAMDRSASSFLVDRFRADQVFYHARKEAYRFRRYSFRDLSIRIRLSASRFRNSKRGFTSASRSHLPVVLVVGGAFLAFQYFLSGGGAAFRHGQFTVNQLLVGLPLCFIWLFVEAGLVEEFFFRALVQSHLAAAFKSEVSGTVLMSLIFGLAHAPGFIFRHAGEVEGLGSNPSALDAVAYSIVVLAISGVTFGVIWARTKNLFAVMLIHAAGDLLPNFAGFAQTWL